MYSIAAGDCFTEGGRGSDRITDGSTSVLFSASAYGEGMTASIAEGFLLEMGKGLA